MKAEYITHYGTDLSAVNAARVSMDKESGWTFYFEGNMNPCFIEGEVPNEGVWKKKLNEKDEKLISFLAKNKHFSCFEHQGATLRLKVPLFVRSQIHRHRTFSYNEVSRRYVKDDLQFYWPDKWRKAADNVKQGSSDEEAPPFKVDATPDYEAYYGEVPTSSPQKLAQSVVEYAVMQYQRLVDQGSVCPEQARMILPQNLMTSFYMTGNLRSWAHFLKLRLDPHAQKEVQIIANLCADIIKPLFPVSYKALMNE